MAVCSELPSVTVFSQSPQIGISYFQCVVAQSTDQTDPLVYGSPKGVEIFYASRTSGKKQWHHDYRFPSLGVSGRMIFTGDNRLGNLFSVAPRIKLRLNRSETLKFFAVGELGLVYCTNPYDRTTNNKKFPMGTALNFSALFGFQTERTIVGPWTAFIEGGMIHFSNGNIRQPNPGLDVFYVKPGIKYQLRSRHAVVYSPIDSTNLDRFSLHVTGTFGLNTPLPYERKTFNSYHAILYGNYRISRVSSVMLGVDYFHDEATRYLLSFRYDLRGERKPDFRKVGLTIGHQLWFGRSSLFFQLGRYVYYSRLAVPSVSYFRIGFKHEITKRLSGSFTVKFHGDASDVAELGLGYKILQ